MKRFWNKVNIKSEDECWLWEGSVNAGGYGLWWKGKLELPIKGKFALAHRVSLYLKDGIWNNLTVLHSCDNSLCVNPKHLRRGTQQDNMNDRMARGRCNSKTIHSQAKVTAIHNADKILTNSELACILQMDASQVSRIRRNLSRAS